MQGVSQQLFTVPTANPIGAKSAIAHSGNGNVARIGMPGEAPTPRAQLHASTMSMSATVTGAQAGPSVRTSVPVMSASTSQYKSIGQSMNKRAGAPSMMMGNNLSSKAAFSANVTTPVANF